mmetsp:Transcript_29331/g.59649  ORF Transcript_29331/g.59649 Transcript_29331/m.59649 type:complete len:216 (-) Transcript_29331:198-845(-)
MRCQWGPHWQCSVYVELCCCSTGTLDGRSFWMPPKLDQEANTISTTRIRGVLQMEEAMGCGRTVIKISMATASFTGKVPETTGWRQSRRRQTRTTRRTDGSVLSSTDGCRSKGEHPTSSGLSVASLRKGASSRWPSSAWDSTTEKTLTRSTLVPTSSGALAVSSSTAPPATPPQVTRTAGGFRCGRRRRRKSITTYRYRLRSTRGTCPLTTSANE